MKHLLALLLLSLWGLNGPQQACAGSLIIDSPAQWAEWSFPLDLVDLQEDGSVVLRRFRRGIDAVADLDQFTYPDAKGEPRQGGIRSAGSNPGRAHLVLDGDPTTWWQPSPNDPLELWQIDIDLGRVVEATRIRLEFPDTTGARPFSEFDVLVSEGSRQVIGKDVFQFTRIGGTTQPTRQRVVEYQLKTLERGNAVGENLFSALHDTLFYAPVQYVRIRALSQNLDAALAGVAVETQGDNIALGTFARGGSLRAGQDFLNLTGIADGTTNKWWTPDGRRGVDWRDSGAWLEWDLGATFWIDQLGVLEYPSHFASTGGSSAQIAFRWMTSNGDPIPTAGESTVQSPFDYQLLSFVDNGNRSGFGPTLKFDFRFAPRQVRYLFYNHDAPHSGFGFRLFEVFLYGAGYPAEVVLTSDFIDLEDAKSLRALSWRADTPPGAQVEIRSRTGDTLVEETLYHSKNGELINQKLWEKLPNSQKRPLVFLTKAGSDWSPWSQAYKIQGQAFQSPSPRRYVQLRAELKNDDPEVAATLRSLRLDFDEPLVSGGIFAQVYPREAKLDSLTVFRLGLQGQARFFDPGFDRLGLVLPGPLAGPVRLRIGDRPVEDLVFEEESDSLLIVDMPQSVRLDSVVVELPLRLRQNAYAFTGWVASGERPDIQQSLQTRDSQALTVFVPEIAAGSLLRKMALSHSVVTPNGDGINDVLQVQLLVVKTARLPQVGVYTLDGRRVVRLQMGNDGHYVWAGLGRDGAPVPPGTYILRAEIVADARSDRRQQLVRVVY